MGIRLFNFDFDFDFDKISSGLCVATSVVLVIIAFIILLKLGEFVLYQIPSLF